MDSFGFVSCFCSGRSTAPHRRRALCDLLWQNLLLDFPQLQADEQRQACTAQTSRTHDKESLQASLGMPTTTLPG